MSTLSGILQHKIVAIIRGAEAGDVMKFATALYKGGVRILEVTLNSPDALGAIELLSLEMSGKMFVGAGTVLSPEAAREAIAKGASFIISPSLDLSVIQATKLSGAVSIPGALTPTEILTAYNNGADIIKVFPASVGPRYFKDLRGPFPQIPLMPTGGVSLDNIREYQKAGAVAYGIGSSLIDTSKEITDEYLEAVTQNAKALMAAVQPINTTV